MSPGGGSAADAPIPILAGEEAGRWVAALGEATAEAGVDERVREILDDVRDRGDAAVRDWTERLDGVRPEPLRVPPVRCRRALEALDAPTREAVERAAANVERFHAAQRREEARVEVEPGVEAWRTFRPLDRVGVYAPGGRAAYPSSLVMAVVPARVAGCGEIVACSPPRDGGEPHPAVMATAALLGVDALFAIGGAQAVGALAHGTATVPAVDKVVGPGGRWVNRAKLAAFERVDVDLPAGPSEVLVWADGDADPRLVAAELLAQAEHGPDSLAAAVLPDRELARRVADELSAGLEAAPRREIAAGALSGSALLVAADEATALGWVNDIAAEHLVILREDEEAALDGVRHAGAVFLGPHTPVAAGDYASGTNHVLPTRRRSRSTGGLSVDDFGKWMQVQRIDADGLRRLGPTVARLAEWEGLPGHAASVRVRLEAP